MVKLINFTEVNPISRKVDLSIKKEMYSTILKKKFILNTKILDKYLQIKKKLH